MNPNQPPNYQRYTPQQQPQYTPSYNNNPNFNHNQTPNQYSLNVPINNQPYSFQNNQDPLQFNNRNKIDRAMYSSTIEPSIHTNNSNNFGFGKLQTMGRFIAQDRQDPNRHKFQDNKYMPNNSLPTYYGQNIQQRPKLQTFTPKQHKPLAQFDRFPSFNINDKANNNQNQGFVSNSAQNTQVQNQFVNQTAQQKRKRQILAIKKELELINKKMQSTNLNKKYLGQNATYDKNVNVNSQTSSTQSHNTGNQYTQSSTNTNNSLNNNNVYNNNDFLQVGNRNKGMVSQSMIVSNQPSHGYKYQSIFDKYDSMKKPTYETHEANKEPQGGLMLDKFVGKGPGLKTNDTHSQETAKTLSQQTTKSYDFKKAQEKPSSTNYSHTYSNQPTLNTYGNNISTSINSNDKPISSTYNTYSSYNSTSTTESKPYTLNSFNESNNEGAMFKKKKENPYTLEAHNAQSKKTLITSPKNATTSITTVNPINTTNIMTTNATSDTNNFSNFKEIQQEKPPQNFFKKTFEQTIVDKKMKQNGIEQETQFKRSDFVVGKKLGKGQFGQVMLVQHKKTGFICGMKVMQKKQIRQEKYQGQIARELSIQFYLAHRNIAPLYGYFQDQANVYLLVQYCTGGQLLEMLRKDRRMEERDASLVIKQICQGIDYIHKEEIIHRDIKPQNILFNFGVAKICDFGWAVFSGNGMRKTASGSPLYYSPQIVMGTEYDQKIDIWDIGMMTYQCLLGKIPFRIYSELDLNRIVEDQIKFPQYIDTTPQAQDFILKIMKKKPQQRMQIKQMMRHPFITKYQQKKLPIQVMEDIKKVLVG